MENMVEEGLQAGNTANQAAALQATVPVQQPQPQNKANDNGEDMLLAEIDAFRHKATQLQQLIQAKERQAAELEALVHKKEEANRLLQEELNRKQAEADSLVADVETQVDRMMQVVKSNMDQLEVDIKDQVSNNQDSYETQHRNLQDTLKSVSDGLDTIQSELSEKTHSESVHLYRLIQDLLQEHDSSVEMFQNENEHFQSLNKKCIALTVITSFSLFASIISIIVALGII